MVKRIVLCLLAICVAAVCMAEISTRVIVLQEGESIVLSEEIQWPSDISRATFDPPARTDQGITAEVVFSQSSTLQVYGPTTVTLIWGYMPEPASPDAIGGGE